MIEPPKPCRFDALADDYDRHAAIVREIGSRLLDRLEGLNFAPERIVDLGCATGALARQIHQRYPSAVTVAVDASRPMLGRAKRRQGWWRARFERVCGQAERLPFADGAFDLAVVNLVLPFLSDPEALCTELRRVLAPGGLLLISSLGPDSLNELRPALGSGETVAVRLIDVQGLGDVLVRAGFSEPVLDTDWLTTTHACNDQALAELSGLGFLAPTAQAPVEGAISRLSWEAVYASAWSPEAGQPLRSGGGEIASVPIERIGIRWRKG